MSFRRVLLGLYAGPAADGIDGVVVTIDGQGEAMDVAQAHQLDRLLPEGERRRVLSLVGGHAESTRMIAELDRDLGIAAAAVGKQLMQQADLTADDVEAVGWSGVSIALETPGASNSLGGEVMLGNPAILADRLGLPVVAGFGASDLAVGGIGQPITAWCDWLLFRHERLSRVIVHLGGVATVTSVPADADPVDVTACEVGPGTLVIDALIHKFHHHLFDTDGATAAAGRVNPAFLNELQSNPYFQKECPKRVLSADWSERHIWQVLQMAQKHGCQGPDLIATMTELTSRTVADAVLSGTERPHEVILTGGGALNIHLAGRIRALLSPSSTYTVEKFGYGLRAKQAACYAILAAARLDAHKAHCPRITGATRQATLGAVWLP